MARLTDRISAELALRSTQEVERSSIDTWITDYLLPANQFNFNGHTYGFGQNANIANGLPQTTYAAGNKTKEIANTLPAYAGAVKRNPPAFAAQMVRALVLAQTNFCFRNKRGTKDAGKTFGTSQLNILERPWPKATTGDLISRMEWHAGLAGNSYVVNRGDRLMVLRPDWVAIVYGSDLEPDDPSLALDGTVVGYVYCNGGFNNPHAKPRVILPEDIAHWCPLPDPESSGVGMSWLTPAIREIQSDSAATEHKLNYFKNSATPNMVIKGLPSTSRTAFEDAVDALEARHTGVANAYRTLYLGSGADATVVGSNMEQMTFAEVQGQGETRITALSRVPAVMIGLSEGLKGAALNAGNFGQVRRMFADTWVFPMMQNLASSLEPIINVPNGAELWFDALDMPILREDSVDEAAIIDTRAKTIGGLVRDGFTPESAVAATLSGDMTLLVPIPGWVSVQLQQMSNPTSNNKPSSDKLDNSSPAPKPGPNSSGK